MKCLHNPLTMWEWESSPIKGSRPWPSPDGTPMGMASTSMPPPGHQVVAPTNRSQWKAPEYPPGAIPHRQPGPGPPGERPGQAGLQEYGLLQCSNRADAEMGRLCGRDGGLPMSEGTKGRRRVATDTARVQRYGRFWWRRDHLNRSLLSPRRHVKGGVHCGALPTP